MDTFKGNNIYDYVLQAKASGFWQPTDLENVGDIIQSPQDFIEIALGDGWEKTAEGVSLVVPLCLTVASKLSTYCLHPAGNLLLSF